MNNKKIVFILFIIILIALIIFFIWNYKSRKTGNTIINKSEEEIVDSILNIKSYQVILQELLQNMMEQI